jgi:hypothetical protein
MRISWSVTQNIKSPTSTTSHINDFTDENEARKFFDHLCQRQLSDKSIRMVGLLSNRDEWADPEPKEPAT